MVVPPVDTEVPLTARLAMPDAAADDRVSAAAGPVPGLVDKPAAVHRADPLTYAVDGPIAPAGLRAAVLENVAVRVGSPNAVAGFPAATIAADDTL